VELESMTHEEARAYLLAQGLLETDSPRPLAGGAVMRITPRGLDVFSLLFGFCKAAEFNGRATAAETRLAAIQALVDEQAEDEALWATGLDGTTPIAEAYLQQELRKLHALIEGHS